MSDRWHREVLAGACTDCGASGEELWRPCASAPCTRCGNMVGVCRCPPCANCGSTPIEHLTRMAVCPCFAGIDAGDDVTQYEATADDASIQENEK